MFCHRSVQDQPSSVKKTTWSRFAAAVVLPAALVLAPGAGADPSAAEQHGAPAVDSPALEVLPAAPAESLDAVPAGSLEALPEGALPADAPAPDALPADAPAEALPVEDAADGLVVVPVAHVDPGPAALPPGVASEHGLQVKTILAERNISAYFPAITSMIGVRPDSKPWHPNGLALDVMIPNAGSSEGIALGNAIRDYALRNADRFGLQDVIWRGVYYTPAGPSGSGYGHFDHVHITTTGGGYPGGGEEYLHVSP